jgi:hypothetical protein
MHAVGESHQGGGRQRRPEHRSCFQQRPRLRAGARTVSLAATPATAIRVRDGALTGSPPLRCGCDPPMPPCVVPARPPLYTLDNPSCMKPEPGPP